MIQEDMPSAIKKRKEIRDGKVAILYSPNHGAGWHTWNAHRGEMGDTHWNPAWLLVDAQLVHLVEEKNKCDRKTLGFQNWVSLICDYTERNYPGAYTGGASDLVIEWLPVDTKFIINEYDGSESIHTIESIDWLIA
jgi:hypothetical protein